MEIIISGKALKYLKKHDANSIIIYAVNNETSAGCCGGNAKRFYVPEVRMGFDNCDIEGYSVYYYEGFKIQLSNKIQINEKQPIVIDIEKILFIEKLIINGIDIKMM